MAAIPVEFKYVKPELPIALCKKPRKDGSCSLDPFSLVSMGGGEMKILSHLFHNKIFENLL
jgi:hypothetical protein